jgi:iron(III) transport system permease protein
MLLIALAVILIERYYIQKHLFSYQNAQKYYHMKLPGSTKRLFTLLVLFLVSLIVIVPLFGLLKEVHSWHYFMTALDKASLPLLHSILFGLVSAVLLMLFGFCYAYMLISKKYMGSNILDTILLFLFILPSTVIGIALIYFWNTPYTQFVYTTPLIILMGYLAKYILLTTKITQTKLRLIPSSMTEAAQLTGATLLQTIRYILIPLSKKVLIVSFLVGLIFSLRESTLTMMLYPPGFETLTVYITTQMANGEPQIIASLCLLMILLILIPLMVLLLTFRRENDTL